MAAQELRFIQIAVAAAPSQGATILKPPEFYLYGLTKDGLVYQWSRDRDAWVRVPMSEFKQ
ncbi:MAG: hypothetical protein HY002_04810 [Candidatus Rokubacteria bacterium]|nr:hypothetical protein [Candidatus Rokubacteria bacterium]